MKRLILILLIISLTITALAGCNSGEKPSNDLPTDPSASFPQHDITGIVQWGAGGGTDSLMRPLSSIAETILGRSLVIQNKPGGTGAIATQYVHDKKADGYTLLMGAENPQLYDVLKISELTYADFEPVFLIGNEIVGVVVGKNSNYTSFKELISDTLANPGKINIATTGKGGMPWTVSSFINAVTGAEFNQIPFDSDQAALTAVLGGHADFTIAKIQAGIQLYKAGEINYLTLMSLEKVDLFPEVSIVTEDYPEFSNYLPWGPFYGIFVKKGTSVDTIKILSEAFVKAYEEEEYQKVLDGFNISRLGLVGDEAKMYLSTWQKNTVEALFKSGAIENGQ